ncbi:hypothetical protein [Streptomyces sp. NPDC002845]
MTVTNRAGYKKAYDFAELPVAGPMQRSLARAFAIQSRGWTSHRTAGTCWSKIQLFAKFLSRLDSPPDDLDGLTVAMMQSWRDRHISTNSGKGMLSGVRQVLRQDSRLADGPVGEELARRIPRPMPSKQSYEEAERDRVVLAAQRQFRSAWLRIGENTRLLTRWRAGDMIEKPLSYRMWSLSFRCSGMVPVSSWERSGDQFVLDDAEVAGGVGDGFAGGAGGCCPGAGGGASGGGGPDPVRTRCG